jgi:penicillin-binding protein 1A
MAPDSPSPASSARLWVQNPARAGLFGWLFRYYVFAALIALTAAALAAHALYRSYAAGLPALDAIVGYETSAPGVTRIYAADGACSPS